MRILYICTHNRCRSILSEAITNHLGGSLLIAASAGSQPEGEVHPLTLKYLAERGVSTHNLYSKSWDDKAITAFNPSVVITVCDSAAKEPCPLWMGKTTILHWNLPDPSKVKGTEQEVADAFYEVMDVISERVKKLIGLAREGLTSSELSSRLRYIAREERATEEA